jgi:hypothetical protein
MQHVAPLVVDYSASRRLVVDYSTSRRLEAENSTSRRLIVDYFASVARPGASHVARLVTRHVAPLVVDYTASHRLFVDYSASRRLVVDYFYSAARPSASARRAAHHAARCDAHRRLLRLA